VRIFLDTNVLVAAVLTHGLCSELVEVTLAQHDLVIDEAVIAELQRVLLEKFSTPPTRVARLVALLNARSAKPSEPRTAMPTLALRDPADLAIVTAAIQGGAEVLVSGDRDLLEADLPILVLSPRELWQSLRYDIQPGAVHEPAATFGP
jgi:putative PIN family toxin of toxin-antitoxin system